MVVQPLVMARVQMAMAMDLNWEVQDKAWLIHVPIALRTAIELTVIPVMAIQDI